jgi:hypothetical protein
MEVSVQPLSPGKELKVSIGLGGWAGPKASLDDVM